MDAIEFVKKFGLEKAKEAITNVAWCETAYCIRLKHGCFKSASDCCIDINDLKQIVEAFDLVAKYSCFDNGRWHFIADYCEKSKLLSQFDSEVYGMVGAKYDKAIELVEKCNASD